MFKQKAGGAADIRLRGLATASFPKRCLCAAAARAIRLSVSGRYGQRRQPLLKRACRRVKAVRSFSTS